MTTPLNRFVAIDKAFELLEAALVGVGLPLQSAYDHAPATLNGETPVMLMLDGGIGREYQGMGTQTFDNEIYIDLQILVAEAVEDDGVTTSEVARKRAEIEVAIAKVVAENQRIAGYWEAIRFTGDRSQVIDIEYKDGNPYKMEVITLVAEAPDV